MCTFYQNIMLVVYDMRVCVHACTHKCVCVHMLTSAYLSIVISNSFII